MNHDLDDYYFLDINWYFRDRFNRICIAASAGGTLPNSISVNKTQNDEFHDIVYQLPEVFKAIRSLSTANQLQGLSEQNLDNYYQDFERLARKGLYVFDRLNINEPEDGKYILVAYPDYNTKYDEYPFDKNVLSLIPKLKRSIITRRNQKVYDSNFLAINLNEILNKDLR